MMTAQGTPELPNPAAGQYHVGWSLPLTTGTAYLPPPVIVPWPSTAAAPLTIKTTPAAQGCAGGMVSYWRMEFTA